MKNNIGIFIFFLIFSLNATAQITQISLEECQQKAHSNYPLINQNDLISQAENYTLENISKAYLPQVSVSAQATYQSEVTKLPISFPGIEIPELNKDQYKATVEVQQLIWDGGKIKSQSKITKAGNNIEKQKTEVSLYAVREKINQLYFGILSANEQLKQLELLKSDLQSNFDLANAMVKNGVAMKSDLDQIQIEFLNLDQKKIELLSVKKAYLSMLSIFINEKLEENTQLIFPEESINISEEITRPELNLFEKQRSLYQAQEEVIKAKNKPNLGAFLQGGFGRPALNMLDNDFKPFAIGGIKISWNFGNFYTKKNEQELIKNDLQKIEIQKDTFLFNTKLQLNQLQPEIEKYQELIQKDDEIISLRNKVKNTSMSKYKNGIYQMNDLISDTNAISLARQAKSMHYIQYLMNQYNYKYIQGK